jgi:hypothetical protein
MSVKTRFCLLKYCAKGRSPLAAVAPAASGVVSHGDMRVVSRYRRETAFLRLSKGGAMILVGSELMMRAKLEGGRRGDARGARDVAEYKLGMVPM